jgi:serine/threonine-protein kinase
MAMCPHCQSQIRAEWKFCPRCERPLADETVLCPRCSGEVDPSFNLCPFCGARLRSSGVSSHEAGGETILGTHTVEHVEGADPPEVQSVAGRYVVEAEIGRGGMGVVYRARDTRLGIAVALKRLIADSAESEVAIRRFLGEGRVVAVLNHVNIVRVHDVDEDEQGRFIVMELVRGRPLDGILAAHAGAFPEDAALNLIRGIAAGLSYAHRKGVIHRDIKPANVLVTDGQVPKLVDFGLARAGRNSFISASGFGMGTFDYAAPEQKRDAKNTDHRADI